MEIWVEKKPVYNFSSGKLIPERSTKFLLNIRNQESGDCIVEEYTNVVELMGRIASKPFNGNMFPIDRLSVELFIELECILEI